jgi:transcriptional regulator with XRE-family HTH domain
MQAEEREEASKELREKLSDRRLRVVAERIGVTYAALSRIMRGGTPSPRTISKLKS